MVSIHVSVFHLYYPYEQSKPCRKEKSYDNGMQYHEKRFIYGYIWYGMQAGSLLRGARNYEYYLQRENAVFLSYTHWATVAILCTYYFSHP